MRVRCARARDIVEGIYLWLDTLPNGLSGFAEIGVAGRSGESLDALATSIIISNAAHSMTASGDETLVCSSTVNCLDTIAVASLAVLCPAINRE